MSTARDLIKGSLRLIGAIATGETPAAAELADALLVLNEMLSSWSTERLSLFQVTRESFPLVGGTASYTIGSGGTFNTERPVFVERVTVEVSGQEYPVEMITPIEYAAISSKAQSGQPRKAYFSGASPLDTVSLYPAPDAANNLILYSVKPFSTFATVNDVVTLPPGYFRAIRYNLAVELGPEYGKMIGAEIASIAEESKSNIKRINTKPLYLDASQPVGGTSGFNILTGE